MLKVDGDALRVDEKTLKGAADALNDNAIIKKLIAQSNSHENEVFHLFLASFIEKSYLTLKYLASISFLDLKNSTHGCQSGTGWFLLGTSHSIIINHKTSCTCLWQCGWLSDYGIIVDRMTRGGGLLWHVLSWKRSLECIVWTLISTVGESDVNWMLYFLLTIYLLKSFKLPNYQIYFGNIMEVLYT